MAGPKSKPRKKAKAKDDASPKRFCGVTAEPERQFDPGVSTERGALILRSGNKWVNGTVLNYYFFESSAKWRGTTSQKNIVRQSFKNWKDLGIGLDFKEVSSADEAEVRIGFERGDGHWSYIGRGVLKYGASKRTMNLDKGDAWGIDTAMHEIGHTLGFPHEHQNPKAGIEWDEEKVYAALAKPPNKWSRSKTLHNIIRKLDPDEVQGSSWDPDSVMHYEFEAGLITKPTKYKTQALIPAPGLSARDKQWARSFYPTLAAPDHKDLEPFRSVRLNLAPAEQANFLVTPKATRRYSFRTFGDSDTVMVLFERVAGQQRYRDGDDDSGFERNASFNVSLYAGREYVLRIRLYYAFSKGDTAVMMW